MSDGTFTRKINIYIESGQAQAAQEVLLANQDKFNAKLETQKQKYKDAYEKYVADPSKKAADAVKKLGNEIDKTKDQIANNTAALDRQTKKVNGELSPSLKDLTANYQRLKREIAGMSQQDAGFETKRLEMNKAKAALDSYNTSLITVKEGLKNMLKEAKGVALGVLVGGSIQAAVQTGLGALGNVGNLRNEFEGKVRNLSAITGATGGDLEFLKQKAIELSTQSTKSASDFIEAMKLIGSAKPELLNDAAALSEVTKQADRLAKASGLDLPDAATRLTDAMNQYGADASEAARYVDVLAAAAKYGAAEVPQVTAALLEFGPVAKQSKISISESAAAIELLAEKGVKGAEAGTKLRNVFLAMSAVDSLPKEALSQLEKYGVNTELLQDKTKSLGERLRELSKISGDANAMMAVFDKQNVVAGQILLSNIPRYEQLAEQVKEVGVASAQAAENTATFSSAWAKFTNTLTSFILNLPTGGLTKIVQSMTSLISASESATEAYKRQSESVTVLNDSTVPLISRYEELSGKTNLNKEEQDELNAIIEKIGKTIPTAISGFDAYGKALGINTDKAREFVKEQQAILALRNKDAIASNTDLATRTEAKIKSVLQDLNRGYKVVQDSRGLFQENVKLSAGEISSLQQQLGDLQKQKEGYLGILKELKGANLAGAQKTDVPQTPGVAFNPMLTSEQQSELSAIKTVSDEKAKAQEKAAKEREDFLKEIEKLENESYLASLSANEREIVAVTQKYDLLEEKAKKFGIDLKRLKVDEYNELHALTEKQYAQDADTEYRLKLKGLEDTFAVAKQFAKQEYADGIIDKEEYNNRLKLLDVALLKAKADTATQSKVDSKAAADDELRALQAAKDAELNLQIEHGNQQVNAARKTEEEITALKKKALQEQSQYVQQAAQFTVSVLQGVGQIMTNIENGELAHEKKVNREKEADFKKRLDGKKMSQKAYDKAIEQLHKQEDERAHQVALKQWKRDRALRLTMAVINTAAAVMNALASMPYPANIAFAAAAAITGGIQIGIIASEKAPEYAAGTPGWRKSIGGDRHSDSSRGNPIVDPNTGETLGVVERGEAFIPVDSTEANQPAINWMLNNRGKPLPNFNFSRAIENVQYATGNSSWSGSKATGSYETKATNTGADNMAMLAIMERHHQEQLAVMKENKNVVFNKDAYDRFNDNLKITFKKQL